MDKENNETFLIEEAAAYVGMSRRSFERLNVGSREEFKIAKDGKQRKVRVFDKSELDRVKAERETAAHTPSVAMTTDAKEPAQVVTASDLQAFAGYIVENLLASQPKLLAAPDADAPKRKTVDISLFKDKLILNFTQARQLSGLNADELRAALDERKIKGLLIGKTETSKGRWKIHRASLEEYCEKYFGG